MTALMVSAIVLLGFAVLFVALALRSPSAEDLWGSNAPGHDDDARVPPHSQRLQSKRSN